MTSPKAPWWRRLNPFAGWDPARWAAWSPNGLGHIKPNHYREMLQVAWKNRDQLPFAWRILSQGVCDGCALGTMGLRDWTMDGVHLCMVRLHLMRMNTAPPLDPSRLADVAALRALDGRALRELGRLAFPMRRRRGEPGFRRVSWDEALDLAAGRIRAAASDRIAFYLTSRGLTNEVYYVAQKVARFLGTNNVDNSARLCHAPSTVALKEMLGVGASTCSYRDWIGSDLIVFFGSNTPNNQPVTTKYLYYAKQQGTRIVVVNPHRELSFQRYWVPSVAESALFGTKLADEFFFVHTGGDAAFLTGVLKSLVEEGGVDREFVAGHVIGFDEVEAAVRAQPWEPLERGAGATAAHMRAFADRLRAARTAVFVWSMGLTQHRHGVDNVRALVNVALARGYLGRPYCGLMPIRGHSGVQGGAEVGCVPGALSGWAPLGSAEAARIEALWGFPAPLARGLSAGEMLEAAGHGELDVLFAAGGNFLDTLPQAERVEAALARVPLRVHQDLVLTTQMLVDPADEVLLLPARTRYESPGGGTETTTERRIVFSPEIDGRRIGESRAEWDILQDLAGRVHPERRAQITFASPAAIRAEIARAVPMYAGIERLAQRGDSMQYGGPRLCEGGHCPTPDGKAVAIPVTLPETDVPEGALRVSTRRGKQFNTIVYGDLDPLTGATRDAIFLSVEDAARFGLRDGDPVTLRSAHGRFEGRAYRAEILPGNAQVHFPEANALLPAEEREPVSGVPDYNTVATLERPAAR